MTDAPNRTTPILVTAAFIILLGLTAWRAGRAAPVEAVLETNPVQRVRATVDTANSEAPAGARNPNRWRQPSSLRTAFIRWVAWMTLLTGFGLALIGFVTRSPKQARPPQPRRRTSRSG